VYHAETFSHWPGNGNISLTHSLTHSQKKKIKPNTIAALWAFSNQQIQALPLLALL